MQENQLFKQITEQKFLLFQGKFKQQDLLLEEFCIDNSKNNYFDCQIIFVDTPGIFKPKRI